MASRAVSDSHLLLGFDEALGLVDELFGLPVEILPLLLLEVWRIVGLLELFQIVLV